MLARIEAGFSSGSGRHFVVLRGLGGQGKTQIALEYCLMAKDRTQAILWIDATSETTLKKEFATIARKIQRPSDSIPGNQEGLGAGL